MKKLKIASILLTSILTTSIVSTNFVQAQSLKVKSSSCSVSQSLKNNLPSLTQTQISELDNFVEMDSNGKFGFINSVKLNSSDKKILKTYIYEANKYVTDLKNEKVAIKVDNVNKCIIVTNQNLVSPGSIICNSIDYSSYKDYSIQWWGAMLYLSHSCVNDMRNYVNTVCYGSAATGAAAGEALVAYAGVSGPVGAAIAGVIAVSAISTYETILARDKGRGVVIMLPWSALSAGSPTGMQIVSR